MESTVPTGSLKRTQESTPVSIPRPKRPKTSKACNACRKQKSRCERLAGDSEACHRCGVIGIPCVFDSESPSTDPVKTRKPRPLLPRETSSRADSAAVDHHEERSTIRPSISENAGLHVLAETSTAMLSRSPFNGSNTHHLPSRGDSISRATTISTPKTMLSPETLSTVESALFPLPRDSTSESETARFSADWRRWVAPLTMLQSLVRRNRANIRPMEATSQPARPVETGVITPIQEMRLKEHFRVRYLPWLSRVQLGGKNGTHTGLDGVSPFLTTVICATAARTLGEISAATIEHLRSLALHHVGQIFANPSAHRLVDSLFAFIIMVMWPLDAADDVALLINGAKQLASTYERGRDPFSAGGNVAKPEADVDQMRLWYTICASETVLTLGAGSTTTPPAIDDLVVGLGGSASDLALETGCTSDILLILQTNLHRVVAVAMREKGISPVPKGPPLSNSREPLLQYIGTVHMFLTRLGEWELEFKSISTECEGPNAVQYAALEIEYHYLRLMFTTRCVLALCHACPLTSASDEVKFALWSWSITGTKSAHALIRLFNAFSRPNQSLGGNHTESLPPLATAPDRIFAMVVVAVMLILRHQVAAYEYGRRRGLVDSPPAGFTRQAENSIRRAIELMGHIGRSRSLVDGVQTEACDHAATRYVDILEALLRIWEEKRAHKVASVAAPVENACSNTDAGYQARRNGETPQVPVNEQLQEGTGDHVGSMQMDLDLSLFGDDLFSDAAFPWDGLGALDWGSVGQ